MPPVAALAGGALGLIGGAAAGVAGLAGAAASVVGSVASGILGGAAGIAGGAASAIGGGISALVGGPAAVAVTPGMEMGQLAAASALGVPAATTGMATGLSTITSAVSAGVGIYGQLANIEIAKGMTEAEKIKAQTALMESEARRLFYIQQAEGIKKEDIPPAAPAAAVPTLAAQPVYVTPPTAPAAPNYLLYAGLAVLAFLLLGKK